MLTILTHVSDLEVKVTDFEILCLSYFDKSFKKSLSSESFSWILLILGLISDTGLNFYTAPSPLPYFP